MVKKNLFTVAAILCSTFIFSQSKTDSTATSSRSKKFVRNGEFYFSWGYNAEWYTRSNINISQPGLNTNVTFVNIAARDHEGWNQDFFGKPLSVPQYNYRIGYFFNEKQTWGLEINFDHTKYVVDTNQDVRMTGTYQGKSVNEIVSTAYPNKTIAWELNNGANFLELNLVRKIKLYSIWKERIRFDALLKVGAGPTIPHVQNTIFGVNNDPHFQFGGWNTDADAALRLTFFKHFFFELYDKVVYARYWGLRLNDGVGKQAFGCYELALVVGGAFKF